MMAIVGVAAACRCCHICADRVEACGSGAGAALKTPWGDPDLQGIWTEETDTPLQRPARFANQEYFTPEQRAELAYNGELIAALLAAFDELGREPVRMALISGNGRNFQAGADINWLDTVRRSSPQDNLDASRMTAEAIRRLNMLPIPNHCAGKRRVFRRRYWNYCRL